MNEERRTSPRYEAWDRVAVTIPGASELMGIAEETIHCTTRDVSLGGLRFVAHTPVPPQTRVSVTYDTADTKTPVQRWGTIVWSRDATKEKPVALRSYSFGIRFDRDPAGSPADWRRIVENRI